MAAPVGAPAKPGTAQGLGRHRLVLAAVLAVAGVFFLRRGGGGGDTSGDGTIPPAADGSLASAPLGDVNNLAGALTDLQSQYSDVSAELAALESSQELLFQYAQAANDAGIAAAAAPTPAAITTSDNKPPPTGQGDPTITTKHKAPAAPGNAKAAAHARDVRKSTLRPSKAGSPKTRHTTEAPPRATHPPNPIPVNHSPAPAPPKTPIPARATTPIRPVLGKTIGGPAEKPKKTAARTALSAADAHHHGLALA